MTPEEITDLIEASPELAVDVILGLQQRVEDLEAAQSASAASDDDDADDDPPNPVWWSERADRAAADPDDDRDLWGDLRRWVDGLNRNGSLLDKFGIKPCWDRHPGVVEELGALYEAWRTSMIAQEAGQTAGTGSMESSIWMMQALWPCLERLRANHYRTVACEVGHHTPDAPAGQ